ncbi:MAG: nodulation protein NfeD [Anaerolineae bacterium]
MENTYFIQQKMGEHGTAARRLAALFLLLLALALAARSLHAQANELLVLEIEGPVTPAMASYFERGIQTAEQEGATAVLIILNTPGGNIDPTQDIVRIFRAAEVPVVIYISPSGAQAASAGSILTIAAHVAAMAPETVIGAASPVGEGGVDLGETIFRKITEDLKAQVRSLAESRGEEAVALAEAMIEEARAVHAQEALDAGLIDVVADDVPDLLRQLDGRVVMVNNRPVELHTAAAARRSFTMNLIEQILHAMSNPLLVSVLLAIGVQAILIELSSPGGWVAGFIGVVSLGLAFYGLGQLPANWFGLGLILVAFVLFALEVKAPTHGALAIAGTLTMLAGLLVMFNSPGTPQFARISVLGAVVISTSTAAFFIFLVTMAMRAQQPTPITGIEAMVGRSGLVRKALTSDKDRRPYRGTVLVMGELWRAEADEPIEVDEKVVVEAVHGFTLSVKKHAAETAKPEGEPVAEVQS